MTTTGPDDLAALRSWGWSERVAALVAGAHDDGVVGVPARVCRVTRRRFDVQAADGPRTIPLAALPTGVEPPVTGDWVLVDVTHEPALLTAVLPRWSRLARIDAMERAEHVLAADVDTVFAVHGLDRPLRIGRIERTLAVGLDGGATGAVVLTKADLIDADTLDAVLGELDTGLLGNEVVVTSARQGRGLDELRRWVRDDRTVVLLGESGAGKSRLVNALLGAEVQATGEVRAGDAKGRHTTSTRDLCPVPGGGVLLDTPGVRALGLWDANEGVAQVFDDLEDLADRCRFADCNHGTEPGCAVRAAVAAGEVDADRVERWLAYIDELEGREATRVEREREGRKLSKTIKAYYGVQGGRRQKGRRR